MKTNKTAIIWCLAFAAMSVAFGFQTHYAHEYERQAQEAKRELAATKKQVETQLVLMKLENKIELRATVERIKRHADSLQNEWLKHPYKFRHSE